MLYTIYYSIGASSIFFAEIVHKFVSFWIKWNLERSFVRGLLINFWNQKESYRLEILFRFFLCWRAKFPFKEVV